MLHLVVHIEGSEVKLNLNILGQSLSEQDVVVGFRRLQILTSKMGFQTGLTKQQAL